MELELYLRCNDWPHVVGVAETWFSEFSVSNIAGYTLYRKNRESLHGHGGVCIYVRSDLNSFEILSIGENDRRVEQIWCGIRRGEEKVN